MQQMVYTSDEMDCRKERRQSKSRPMANNHNVDRDGHKPHHRALVYRDGESKQPKAWMSSLQSRFARAQSDLNSSRRQLLREVLDNAHETYFLSSRELAKRYKVDGATIVRTIQALGYKRYADFLADLRSHFVSRITPYTVLKAATREHRSLGGRVEHSLDMEATNLDA